MIGGVETEIYRKDKADRVLQEIEDEILKSIRLKYAIELFQRTSMLPFKTYRSPGFRCFYCDSGYKTMEELIDHMGLNHENPHEEEIEDAIAKYKRKFPIVSVNVVDLECKLCDETSANFKDLENHLSMKHDIEVVESKDPVVVPFKIANGKFKCALCGKSYGGFNAVSNHMNDHYPNYKCDICNAAFMAPDRLKYHSSTHVAANEENAPAPKIRHYWNRLMPKRVVSTIKNNEKQVRRIVIKKKIKDKRTTDSINDGSFLAGMGRSHNVIVLLRNSNILPFKTSSGFTCFYCKSSFGVMEELRDHNTEKHYNPDDATIRHAISKLKTNQILKVNIANLKCSHCDDYLEAFDDLKAHLSKKHAKKFIPDDDFVVPFKVANGVCECALCGEKQPGCKALSQHMNKHYRKYICEQCGVGFLTPSRLKSHALSHLNHTYPCDECGRAFKSRQAMSGHKNYVHKRQNNNKCPHCSEMFHDYYAKQKHISVVHNIKVERHKCDFCPSNFLMKGHLAKHVKVVHEKQRSHQCLECDKKFYYESKLEEHIMSKHVGVYFACDLCPKSYAVKKTLAEHMRKAHPNSSYVCEHCDRNFVLKISLEKHIKEKHRYLVSAAVTC